MYKMCLNTFIIHKPKLLYYVHLYYMQAGELSKALELCFQYRQYEVLHVIAEELSEGCNPETLKKVAEFFVEQEQFDKAVDLLIRSNRVCIFV